MADDTNILIYVGPTSQKLGLQFMSYYTGLTSIVQEALDQNPAMGQLLRPLTDFPNIRDEVLNRTNGSIQHAIDALNATGVL